MTRIVTDLFYFPSLEYFSAILPYQEILLSRGDLFRRNSLINRTEILGPNKRQRLSIPIQGRRPRIPQGELKIDYSQKWVQSHLRSIQTAYGKAPFYEHYFPYFEAVLLSQPERLWDLNSQILTLCLRLLQISAKVAEVDREADLTEEVDIRGLITTQERFSERKYYHPIAYFQLFGVDFEPNLSILDLLFCMGPESNRILQYCAKKP
ncbi:WbqC family protein [Algoriphagus namhaensis]